MAVTTAPQDAAKDNSGSRPGRWIDYWEPEDPEFWETTGKSIARRNLIFSSFSEHLGFSVWLLWSVVSVRLVKAGFSFTPKQLFLLLAVPNLVGSLIRLPYTFAVPKFGGRNWTMVSALMLTIPTLLFAYFVQHPETPFWVFVEIASTAGLGGGNLGVALIQFFLPIIVGGAGVFGLVKASESGLVLQRAGYLYAGLAVVAAVCACFFLNNLTTPGPANRWRS
ncbi:MAG: hypothetical protein H7288_22390 [Kineosporiaceae bacterium]|nr:hypothetical protein [Aeromicrobium sp.]